MRHDQPFYPDCYRVVVRNDGVRIKNLQYERFGGCCHPCLWDCNEVESSWAAIAKTRFEKVPLALVTPAVCAWQCQVVTFKEFTKDACILGCFLGRLVGTNASVSHLDM